MCGCGIRTPCFGCSCGCDHKPPSGLGAVVEDIDGNRWLIVGGPQEFADEWYSPDLNVRAPWPEIAAVRVLSEGVTP